MSKWMHKAVRPKSDYSNPTLCRANLTDENAHRFSRTRWPSVDCPKCMEIRVARVKASKGWKDMMKRRKR